MCDPKLVLNNYKHIMSIKIANMLYSIKVRVHIFGILHENLAWHCLNKIGGNHPPPWPNYVQHTPNHGLATSKYHYPMPFHVHGKPQHVHRGLLDTFLYQLDFACMTKHKILENEQKWTTNNQTKEETHFFLKKEQQYHQAVEK